MTAHKGKAGPRRSLLALLGGGAQPQHVRDIVRRADQARDRGDFQQAATLYRQVVRARPRHAGAWVQLGNMLKDTGRLADAEDAYCKALSLRPGHSDTLLQLGHLMNRAGHTAEAVKYYEQSLESDRGNSDASHARAALASLPTALHADAALLSVAERSEVQELIGVLRLKSSQGYVMFKHGAFHSIFGN